MAMRTITRLVLTIAAAVLVGATIPAAVIAIDPPPEEPLARMTALMDGMQRSMEALRDDMRGMPNMGAMHGRMDRAMGMAEELRTLMRQHRERPRPECPAARPSPPRTDGH
jgi:hypothetical protein